jgi:hypothetical protein
MSCLVRSVSSARYVRLFFGLILLTLAALLPTAGRAQTFSNSGTISIPDGGGTNVPSSGQYPVSGTCTNSACVAVSGLTGSYTSMAVNLTFTSRNSQTFPSAAWLLESPGGEFLDLLSYGCADDSGSGTITITLTDGASSLFPSHTVNCNLHRAVTNRPITMPARPTFFPLQDQAAPATTLRATAPIRPVRPRLRAHSVRLRRRAFPA